MKEKRFVSWVLAVIILLQFSLIANAKEIETVYFSDMPEMVYNDGFDVDRVSAYSANDLIGYVYYGTSESSANGGIKGLTLGNPNLTLPVTDLNDGHGNVMKIQPSSVSALKEKQYLTMFGYKWIKVNEKRTRLSEYAAEKKEVTYSVDIKPIDYTYIDKIAVQIRDGNSRILLNKEITPTTNEWCTVSGEFNFDTNVDASGNDVTLEYGKDWVFVIYPYYKNKDAISTDADLENVGVYIDNLSMKEMLFQDIGENMFVNSPKIGDASASGDTKVEKDETIYNNGTYSYKVTPARKTTNVATEANRHLLEYTLTPYKLVDGRQYRATLSIKLSDESYVGQQIYFRQQGGHNIGICAITNDAVSGWQTVIFDFTADSSWVVDGRYLYFNVTTTEDLLAQENKPYYYLADISLETLPKYQNAGTELLAGEPITSDWVSRDTTVYNNDGYSYKVTPAGSSSGAGDTTWRGNIWYDFSPSKLVSGEKYLVNISLYIPDDKYVGQTLRFCDYSGKCVIGKEITNAAVNGWQNFEFVVKVTDEIADCTKWGFCVSTTEDLLKLTDYSYYLADMSMVTMRGNSINASIKTSGNTATLTLKNTDEDNAWIFDGKLYIAEYSAGMDNLVQVSACDVNERIISNASKVKKLKLSNSITSGNIVKAFLWEKSSLVPIELN